MTLEPVEEMAGWWWMVLRERFAKIMHAVDKGKAQLFLPKPRNATS